MSLRPDITVSLLRRDINFMTKIKDGSKKVGELHVNRANYRNYESNDTNIIKQLFSKYWMNNLTHHLRELDRLVVLTEEDRLQWTELNNVDVIPDPLSFHTDVVSPLTSRRVIAVGRYVYQKGFDMLLQAWSIVEKKCDWELVIYGQGNRSPYEKIIADLDLDRNRCHVYGPTNDIKAEYLNSSAFVFSSRFEGFGMVLIEAMACGLPVVSFDCPCGPKDIVSDQVDGYLVPNGDVEMLADKLLCLILHPDDAKRLSEGAIRKAGNYTIDVIARRWKSLYNSLWEQV